jgi:hypothetical protein
VTLVVGVHLGDAVGLMADTRATIEHPDGRVVRRDDVLKVYNCPPVLAAFAGRARAASRLVGAYHQLMFGALDERTAYLRSVEEATVRAGLLGAYERCLAQNIVLPDELFSCVLAMENSPALRSSLPTGSTHHGVHAADFASSTAMWSRADEHHAHRLVIAARFPSCDIEALEPGESILVGSGKSSEKLLAYQRTVVYGQSMSFGDRIAAIGADFVRAATLTDDPSFNACMLGIGVGCGEIEGTLHGLHAWPTRGLPIEAYVWTPWEGNEGVPDATPFAAGLDRRHPNVGWIYDVRRRTKLRLATFVHWATKSAEDEDLLNSDV